MKTKLRATLYALLYLVSFALCALTLASCEKAETEPVKEPTWYLDFAAPDLTVQNLAVAHIYENRGANDIKVGNTLDFESALLICRIFMEGDKITQWTGIIRGKPFNIKNGGMNVCGGEQGVNVQYKLEYK